MFIINFLFVVFVLLQIADVASTMIALNMGAREANPVMRWLFEKIGVNPALYTVKVSGIVLLWVYGMGLPVIVWLIMVGVYVAVVYNNARVILELSSKDK